MKQIELFAAPPRLTESAGEADRVAARRRAWRVRQKRCRALKKWRAQLINAPLDQAAVMARRKQARQQLESQWSDAQFCEWMRALNVVLGALLHGGQSALRALELVEPREIFDERFVAIWEAMKALHQRRARVDARSVSAQLRRTGILVLLDLGWLESGTMPRPTVADVEVYAAFLNAVVRAEPRAALAAAA